jgi:hypothetical protein
VLTSSTGLARATCGSAGHALVEVLVKAALHGAQFQVGLAVDGAHGLENSLSAEALISCTEKRQRHAQHHGDRHGGGIAPRVVLQLAPGKA